MIFICVVIILAGCVHVPTEKMGKVHLPYPEISHVSHTGVSVMDIEKTAKWFKEKFGFPYCIHPTKLFNSRGAAKFLGRDYVEVEGGIRWGFIQVTSKYHRQFIELFEYPAEKNLNRKKNPAHNDIGYNHICFVAKNFKEAYKKLIMNGVETTIGLKESDFEMEDRRIDENNKDKGAVNSLYFLGPDNIIIELIDKPGFVDQVPNYEKLLQ